MIKKLYQNFSRLYDKQIDARGLAIFRIVFSLVLLAEVIQLYYFRHLIFDRTPYLIRGEIEMWPALLFWMAALIFIIFGLFTRIAAIINYILTVVVIGTISTFEYHMFYPYLTITFLYMFLPLSKTYSLDRLILKLRYSNTRFKYNPSQTVSVLAYYIPVLAGIGFVYFDSIFYKYRSDLWLHGLGVWLPASVPQSVFANLSLLLNFKYLNVFLSWLTLIFETVFIFIFWKKKLRISLLIIGVGLHVGILLFFPIPLFALGVIAIYLLMVPVHFWARLFDRKKKSLKIVKFYYDKECPLCNRTMIVLNHFDTNGHIEFLTVQKDAQNQPALKDISTDVLLDNIYAVDNKGKIYIGLDTYIRVFNTIWYLKPISWILKLPGIYDIGKKIYRKVAINRTTERCIEDNCGYVIPVVPDDDSKFKILKNVTLRDLKSRIVFYGCLILIVLQVLVSYNSPLSKYLRKEIGITGRSPVVLSERIASSAATYSKIFFGITHHGVFVDSHFKGYQHTISVIYKPINGQDVWLPIADKDGTTGAYLIGPVWAKWGFRVNSPLVDQEKLTEGIKNFTAFWAYRNNINLKDATFEIKVKKNVEPTKWEFDFLNKQLSNPWLDAGSVKWKDDIFTSDIKIIEEM